MQLQRNLLASFQGYEEPKGFKTRNAVDLVFSFDICMFHKLHLVVVSNPVLLSFAFYIFLAIAHWLKSWFKIFIYINICLLLPVTNTPEKTQHCPYLTGSILFSLHCLRILTLPLQDEGLFPSLYSPSHLPHKTPVSSLQLTFQAEQSLK